MKIEELSGVLRIICRVICKIYYYYQEKFACPSLETTLQNTKELETISNYR